MPSGGLPKYMGAGIIAHKLLMAGIKELLPGCSQEEIALMVSRHMMSTL